MSNLRRAVSDALVADGFERDDRLLRLRVDDEWAWIIDTGFLDPDGQDMAPWLGLRHDSVQRVLTECKGRPGSAFVGTAGSNVGYILGGGYRIWAPSASPASVLDGIQSARAVLEKFMTLRTLPGAYEIRGAKSPLWRFRLACIYYLLADEPGLESALAEGARTECRHQDAVCDQFRKFEAAMRAKWRDRGA